jgi:hypothetical protein
MMRWRVGVQGALVWGLVLGVLGLPIVGAQGLSGVTPDVKVLDQPPSGFFTKIAFAHGYKEVKDAFQTDRYKPDRPTVTFQQNVEAVYLVFEILPRENPAHILGQLFLEKADGRPSETLLFEEGVYLQTSQDSGFLMLPRPKDGWAPGTYKVKIHLGEQVTEASQLGTLRFTIVPGP